ncbi:MAG: DUF6676 family protein [Nakamurella sp.]
MPTNLLRRLLTLLAVLVVTLSLGLLPSGPAAAGAVGLADDDIIGGITVSQAADDLRDDGVAVVSSSVQAAALTTIVADARSRELEFGVLVTDIDMSQTSCNDLAGALGAATGLTVLVLTPHAGKASSSTLSSAVLSEAQDAAAAHPTDDIAAARAFVAKATEKSGGPWMLIGGVALVLVIGVLGWWWSRRRSKDRAGHHLEELTAGLQQRSAALADQILGLSERVEVLGRPDLEARFDQAGADYSRVQETLGQAVTDRVAVNTAATGLSDLERRLDQLDREVDALAPGIQPPSPAG